ncbi:MAG: type II secretion system protein [Sedimentisphaerales bacterium]|nr:type II secretion system protein [Sedimentisphaerales bacterium]
MRPVAKATRHGRAFTIVELLTVMSIIVILIGLLVPALNKVKQYATNVRQKAQFHSIEAALELFDSQFGGYPDSGFAAAGTTGADAYCGALKLCEAMMGQDLMGFHPDSVFRSDGRASRLLATGTPVWVDLYTPDTMSSRPGPFLPLENANAYRLKDIYGEGQTAPFNEDRFVLCDVFNRVTNTETGRRIGMPVLYYKANTSKQVHDLTNPNNPDNIYNYRDNADLLRLGMPWDTPTRLHRLLSYSGTPPEPEGQRFYWNIRNEKVSVPRPYKADSYILISAGWDGEYGTADDICNFDWSFRDQLQ